MNRNTGKKHHWTERAYNRWCNEVARRCEEMRQLDVYSRIGYLKAIRKGAKNDE